jgi:hypothetical protein
VSEDLIARAIRDHFYTGWKVAQGFTDAEMLTRVAWPNKTFAKPNPPASWVRLTILPAAAFLASLGAARTYRHSGLVTVQTFVPENTRDKVAWTLAGQAAALFRGVTAGGVHYEGLRGEAPRIQVVGNRDGYYQLNVNAPFWSDLTE